MLFRSDNICLSPPLIFLSCIHCLPIPLTHPFPFPLPLALYTGGKLHPYQTSICIFHASIYRSSSFSLFDLDFHFPFIHPYALSMSLVHCPSILLYTFIHLSYVIDLGYPFHFLHFILHISSISLSIFHTPHRIIPFFHTLPPISLIHSSFISMLMIIIRGTFT